MSAGQSAEIAARLRLRGLRGLPGRVRDVPLFVRTGGLMTAYTCVTCQREVDPDTEPSPGEPTWCADCHHRHDRHDREEQLRREWWDDDDPEDAA